MSVSWRLWYSWLTSPVVLKTPRLLASRQRRSAVGRPELSGEPGGLQQRLARRRVTALALGIADAHHERAALDRVGTGHPVEQGQRLAIPPQRLVRREPREGGVACGRAIGDGLVTDPGVIGRGACLGEVVGELGEPLARGRIGHRLDGLRDALARPHPSRRRQRLVQRLPDERVREAEADSGHVDDQRCRGPARSSTSSTSSAGRSAAPARTPRSKSRPITAARVSSLRTSPPSRLARWTITVRTPVGSPCSPRLPTTDHRPASSRMIASVSAKWRRSSPTKKGLPSVSRASASRSATPRGSPPGPTSTPSRLANSSPSRPWRSIRVTPGSTCNHGRRSVSG